MPTLIASRRPPVIPAGRRPPWTTLTLTATGLLLTGWLITAIGVTAALAVLLIVGVAVVPLTRCSPSWTETFVGVAGVAVPAAGLAITLGTLPTDTALTDPWFVYGRVTGLVCLIVLGPLPPLLGGVLFPLPRPGRWKHCAIAAVPLLLAAVALTVTPAPTNLVVPVAFTLTVALVWVQRARALHRLPTVGQGWTDLGRRHLTPDTAARLIIGHGRTLTFSQLLQPTPRPGDLDTVVSAAAAAARRLAHRTPVRPVVLLPGAHPVDEITHTITDSGGGTVTGTVVVAGVDNLSQVLTAATPPELSTWRRRRVTRAAVTAAARTPHAPQ